MKQFEIGDTVRYVLPTMGINGVGKIGATSVSFARAGNPKIYYVALEAKDKALAVFVVKDGKTWIADGNKGTHRAFYAETLERIEA